MKISPTARTLKELRRLGYRCQVVEQTVPHTFIKRDLFGFIDIIAVGSAACGRKTLAVQATTGDHVAERLAKIRTYCLPALRDCLWAGWRVEVWGWSKQGARGERKTWQVRRVGLNMTGETET